MRLHGNAALSWQGRRRPAQQVVEQGWSVRAAAAAAGVSVRCARKWSERYRLEGELGLHDRSSAPKRVANRTAEDRVDAIVKLRRLRFTAAEIAETLGMARSTVSGVLTRTGTGKLGRCFHLRSRVGAVGCCLLLESGRRFAPTRARRAPTRPIVRRSTLRG